MGKNWILGAAMVGALAASSAAEERQRLLVVHQDEGVLTVLDPVSGAPEGTIRVGLGAQQVAVSPDGRRAVVTNRGTEQGGSSISLVDVEGQRLLRTIALTLEQHRPEVGRVTVEYHRPAGVCFTRDPRRVLVTCETEQALLLIDLEEARVVDAVELEQEKPGRILLDREGRRAFVANEGAGSVSVVDLGRRRVVATLETGGGARDLALHPTLDELWVTNYGNNSISVVDTQTLEEVFEFPVGACPAGLTFTLDGARALCVNQQEGSLSVFDATQRRLVGDVKLERLDEAAAEARPLGEDQTGFGRSALPSAIRLTPDGRTAWVSLSRSDRVAELDVESLEVVRYLDSGARAPLGIAWAEYEDDVAHAK